ncbi:hypothetical protein PRVXT_000882 [Proteinivorax tanatarense]|uniref:Phage protein n=1 Tax=Proteinivorax tanatarense TaxID=1260629 RepID=A0AAU7VNT7_9FIRM
MGNQINMEGIVKNLSQCCLSCAECSSTTCLVSYDKRVLNKAILGEDEFVDGGLDGLNIIDTKVYDEDEVIDTIGYLLNQCKNCKLYHDEDCIINVIRSSLELILLGEYVDYEGSVFMYLNNIKDYDEKKAEKISQAYSTRRMK